jgi:hypothetical protein
VADRIRVGNRAPISGLPEIGIQSAQVWTCPGFVDGLGFGVSLHRGSIEPPV